MLGTQHGKSEEEIRARIADEALAPRVRLVLQADAAAAADELDEAPPAFELGDWNAARLL